MDIVFFGTSEFAVESLERLAGSRHKIKAVVTQPDRKKGRLQKILPTAVKESALKLGVEVLQPEDLSSPEFIERLKLQNADLFIVVSYGNILKKEILGIPKKFCINLHGSLLPKYRGAAPINWTIINSDETTGVTIIKMNEKMDEGDIILKDQTPVLTHDTAESLSKRLALRGSELLLKALDMIESGKAEFQEQDDAKATYAPKLKKEDGLINWDREGVKIQSHIRGVQPWPGAYTYLNGKLIKIWKASIYGTGSSRIPGEVIGIEKDGILVSTRQGAIVIEELQPESSRRMDINAFLAGYKLKVGDRFESKAAISPKNT
jgi:methionyl-tRNA formyltransferase